MKSKTFILFIFLKVIVLSQTENKKWHYFAKFQEPGISISKRQEIIQHNWKQYFKKDIFKEISEYDYYPLMLDSYGSPYPDERLFTNTDSTFFAAGIKKDIDTYKYSMYKIFKNNENKEVLNKNLDLIEDPTTKAFYDTIINTKFANVNEFYNKYDSWHMEYVTKGITEKMRNKSKILIYIHGYNVPYSLACIQADALMDILKKEASANTDDILIVPLFWSSNDAKECHILSEETFSTKNQENLKNGKKFRYYSNRAYYAGLGLRKILNTIDSCKQVLVFSHSLGATIATTAFINTTSKLDFNLKPFLDSVACNRKVLKNNLKFEQEADPVTKDLVKEMLGIALPENGARVFLSAAAIPGTNTFKDVDYCLMSNKKFYLAINPNDIMLTKNVARRKFPILKLVVHPNKFSSTTLGMNYENDALITKLRYPFKNNFIIELTSLEDDHEIFTYMNQQAYIDLIVKWYNNTN